MKAKKGFASKNKEKKGATKKLPTTPNRWEMNIGHEYLQLNNEAKKLK